MTSSEDRTAPVTQAEPEHARAVLLALILVAAVANLNLAVANVALPDIGTAFDSSQTALDLIAVGYSLGLAASVLYLGALGDRLRAQADADPRHGARRSRRACSPRTRRPTACCSSPDSLGGLAAGMAYPTTLALITALWSGPARTKSIALWSALGGAISALGPLLSGLAAGALLVGVGLPRHAAAGRRGARPGDPARAGARERDDRSGRQPRRHPVGRVDRGAGPRDQLRAGPERGDRRPGARRDRGRRGDRVHRPAAPRPQPACTTCTSPAGGSSGWPRAPASSCSAR